MAQPSPDRPAAAAWTAVLLIVASCGGDGVGPPPPLTYGGLAYDAAAEHALPEVPPTERPGLHNVYTLSENIISGSEPHGEEAFEELAAMGVRTILSVDGATPDAEAAERHGMRYVHVPIQYRGIAPDELIAMSKTFRELDGPFYVHCFHGKHRGPAAAAIGRLVLDGVDRSEALAEMRQWCGTSPEYEGLYETVATAPLPDEATTAASPFDFPTAHPMEGVRGVMVPVPRAHDALKAMAGHGWAVDPAQPDLDPVHEAELMHGYMLELREQAGAEDRPDDFLGWTDDGIAASDALHAALRAGREGLGPDDPVHGSPRERADAALARLGAACKACHSAYRN